MIGRGGSAKRRSETCVIDLATRPEILSKDDARLTSSLPRCSRSMRSPVCSRSAQGKPVLAAISVFSHWFSAPLRRTCSTIIGYRRTLRCLTCCAWDHRRSRAASLCLLIIHHRANIDKRSVGCVRIKLCQQLEMLSLNTTEKFLIITANSQNTVIIF